MSDNRLSISKRAIRITTALALVAVMAVIAVSLLLTGVGGVIAFNNTDGSDTAAIHIPAQYTEQCSNGIALLYPERNPGLLSDCAALLAAKDALEGEGGRQLNWSANTLIHSWDGVSVDISDDNATYRVLYLRLGGYGLAGTLPPELGNLANLEDLRLNNNDLTGAIPPELGNLANLTHMELYSNQLTGAIPAKLGNLANLDELHLNHNQMTGTIPAEFGNLAKLEGLHLNDNQLTGAIPPTLGNLDNLIYMWLNNNQLMGAIPPELGNLANLSELTLDDNQITGAIPPELGNLAKLWRLRLNSNRLTGAIPPELGNLANLGELTLGGNHFTGCIPASLRRLLDSYEHRAGIVLPFCDDAPVPPAPTPVTTHSPTPTPTGAPSETATATPTATPMSYDALLSRLIALETRLAEVVSRLAALEGGAAIAPPIPTQTATPTPTPSATPASVIEATPTATPSPTPTSVAATSDDACIERLAGNGSVNGRWTRACLTANSPDNKTYYARFYTFTLYAASEVTITLSSDDAAPYLFLLEGAGTGGTVKQEKGAANANSISIIAALQPGAYTIEASTYRAETAGDFTLEMEVAR